MIHYLLLHLGIPNEQRIHTGAFSLLGHSVISLILWGNALRFNPRRCSCTSSLFRFAFLISSVSLSTYYRSLFSRIFPALRAISLEAPFHLFPSCLGMSSSSWSLISVLCLIHAFVALRCTLLSSSCSFAFSALLYQYVISHLHMKEFIQQK